EDVVSALRASEAVLPARPERPHITEAAPLEEAVKAPPPPVPAQKEPAPPRTDMAHETPAPADTRSNAAAAGGPSPDPVSRRAPPHRFGARAPGARRDALRCGSGRRAHR